MGWALCFWSNIYHLKWDNEISLILQSGSPGIYWYINIEFPKTSINSQYVSFKHKRHLFGISVQQSKVWRGIHEPLKSICICAHYYCYKPESMIQKKNPRPLVATNINSAENMPKLDPLGSTVHYQVMNRVSHFYTFFELSLVLLTTQAHGL